MYLIILNYFLLNLSRNPFTFRPILCTNLVLQSIILGICLIGWNINFTLLTDCLESTGFRCLSKLLNGQTFFQHLLILRAIYRILSILVTNATTCLGDKFMILNGPRNFSNARVKLEFLLLPNVISI
mgnify:CR=1 FL=1